MFLCKTENILEFRGPLCMHVTRKMNVLRLDLLTISSTSVFVLSVNHFSFFLERIYVSLVNNYWTQTFSLFSTRCFFFLGLNTNISFGIAT